MSPREELLLNGLIVFLSLVWPRTWMHRRGGEKRFLASARSVPD